MNLLPFPCRATLILLTVLALVLLSGQSLPASPLADSPPAEELSRFCAAPSPCLLFAADDGWSIKHLYKGLNTRTGVVQFCAAVMCLALFILIKK